MPLDAPVTTARGRDVAGWLVEAIRARRSKRGTRRRVKRRADASEDVSRVRRRSAGADGPGWPSVPAQTGLALAPGFARAGALRGALPGGLARAAARLLGSLARPLAAAGSLARAAASLRRAFPSCRLACAAAGRFPAGSFAGRRFPGRRLPGRRLPGCRRAPSPRAAAYPAARLALAHVEVRIRSVHFPGVAAAANFIVRQ